MIHTHLCIIRIHYTCVCLNVCVCVCSISYQVGILAMGIVMETASTIVGDHDKACALPLFEVAVDKLCACCYERAWFSKNGGCSAIEFLVDKMPLKWVLAHQLCFLMALVFVLLDLTGEVSSGTIYRARGLIDKLLSKCNTPLSGEMKVCVLTHGHLHTHASELVYTVSHCT